MARIRGAQVRVRSCELGAPVLGTSAAVLADTALDGNNPTVVAVFAGQPDVPRNVTVQGNAAGSAGNVTIDGRNAHGVVVQETIALNGAASVAGNRAFASIVQVTLPKYAAANTERVRVGLGAKLGLGVRLSRNSVLAAFLGGVREAAAPAVAVSPTTLSENTATLASALTGAAVIVDLYDPIT